MISCCYRARFRIFNNRSRQEHFLVTMEIVITRKPRKRQEAVFNFHSPDLKLSNGYLSVKLLYFRKMIIFLLKQCGVKESKHFITQASINGVHLHITGFVRKRARKYGHACSLSRAFNSRVLPKTQTTTHIVLRCVRTSLFRLFHA